MSVSLITVCNSCKNSLIGLPFANKSEVILVNLVIFSSMVPSGWINDWYLST